jgi:toxin ParE1/3/4
VSKTVRRWTVRLTASAEADFEQITRWTIDQFGDRQALAYVETISLALDALTAGPDTVGAKPRDEIIKGLFSLHVAREGRKGRHFVMFRVVQSDPHNVVEVLRLLHDSMDLQRHFEGVLGSS